MVPFGGRSAGISNKFDFSDSTPDATPDKTPCEHNPGRSGRLCKFQLSTVLKGYIPAELTRYINYEQIKLGSAPSTAQQVKSKHVVHWSWRTSHQPIKKSTSLYIVSPQQCNIVGLYNSFLCVTKAYDKWHGQFCLDNCYSFTFKRSICATSS